MLIELFVKSMENMRRKYKLTMPIRRKPGEIMEVDWAGSTLHIMIVQQGKVFQHMFLLRPYLTVNSVM